MHEVDKKDSYLLLVVIFKVLSVSLPFYFDFFMVKEPFIAMQKKARYSLRAGRVRDACGKSAGKVRSARYIRSLDGLRLQLTRDSVSRGTETLLPNLSV